MQSKKDYEAKIVWLKPEDLIPYDKNTKKHPEDQIQRLIANIYANGFDQPITVDKNNVIITGHGRQIASIRLKLSKVPVIVRDDLSESQVRAKRIADNKLNESAWEMDYLRFELGGLILDDEIDATITGFDENEINEIMNEGDINDLKEELEKDLNADKNNVTVVCGSQSEAEEIYDELTSRGMQCKITT